jgi:hypothetical protein
MELLRINTRLAQTARDFQRRATADLLRSASGNRRAVRFDVGDMVMVYREPVDVKESLFTKPKDFVASWLGPFVVRRVEGTCYTVQALCDGPGITAGAVLERTVKNVKAFKGAVPVQNTSGGGSNDAGGGGVGGGVGHRAVGAKVGSYGASGGGGDENLGRRTSDGDEGGAGGAGGKTGPESWELELEVPASWRPGSTLKFAHDGMEYSVDLEGDVAPGSVIAVRVPARGYR